MERNDTMNSGIRTKFSLEKILIRPLLTFGGWCIAIWLVFPEASHTQIMLGAMVLTVIHIIMRRVCETTAKETEISESHVKNE